MIVYMYVASQWQDPRFRPICSHNVLVTPSLSLVHKCSHKHTSTGEPTPSILLAHLRARESWNHKLEETINGYIGNVILNPSHPMNVTDFCIFYIFQFWISPYIFKWTEHTLLMPAYRRGNIRIQSLLWLFSILRRVACWRPHIR